ncbi:helix-turn-helix domain-containing protein [Geodermatophilus sp. SYSU D00691]
MSQSPSLFDLPTIRAALQQSGLAPSDIAFRVDIAVRSLQRILDGDPDPGEIRLATLARLANTLGLPLRSLIAPPQDSARTTRAPHDAEVTDPAPDDASTVIALLYDRSTAAINSEVAVALGWSLDRLKEALREADQRLRPAGLRIVREHGESSIHPVADHLRARAALDRVQAHVRGLKVVEYRAAYEVHSGQKVTAPNEARRRFVLGRLANVGVIDLTGKKVNLSAAAKFAHPLDRLPGSVPS